MGRRPGSPGRRHGRKGHRPERRPLIHARKLGRAFGARRVIRDLDLDLPRGGFLLVTGPNGSGKTTLLRLVAGLLVPTAGELCVDSPRDRVGFLGHEPLVYRELLVLDEPFSAVDEDGGALLDRELADLRPRATFLVTTHDPARVAALATDRLALA